MAIRFLALFVLAVSYATVSYGDVAVGVELIKVNRNFSLEGTSLNIEGNGFSGFLGLELENSMLFLRYSENSIDSQDDVPNTDYSVNEFAAEWAWNEKKDKNRYVSLIMGFLANSHSAGGLDAEFVGASLGVGGTIYVSDGLFFAGDLKLKLLYPTSDLPGAPEDENGKKGFVGTEVRASVGYLFSGNPSVAVRVGGRLVTTDFDGYYPDDKNGQLFAALRLYFSS